MNQFPINLIKAILPWITMKVTADLLNSLNVENYQILKQQKEPETILIQQ